MKMKDAATEFLGGKRIAVTGVSRHPETHSGNTVYRRLRERGYDVFAVNHRTLTRSKAIAATTTCARFPTGSTES